MRRKQSIDNRLSWRDPDMPVFAKGKYWPPEAMKKSAEYGMNYKPMPKWNRDETYNLRRKK